VLETTLRLSVASDMSVVLFNKADRHDITEILLTVALNTITITAQEDHDIYR
jgi:hypothetical protein